MTDTIPSAEKMLAFLADASPDHIRKITAAAWDVDESQFNGHFCSDRREYAARYLCAAWDRKVQWWKAHFSEDEVQEWLWSLESVGRAWDRVLGKRRRLLRERKDDSLDIWREHIEKRLRLWASRVIEKGRTSQIDWPLNRYWLERRADDVNVGWQWMHGVGSALYDYLYTDGAGDLIRERQAIRKMHADAINGLRALEAFMGTKFSRHSEGRAFWGTDARRPDHIRRMAFEALGKVDFDAFYPSKRHDATAAERLLVASLSDLHCKLYRTPKPEAIAEIMTAPFIRNPLDMRSIERLCARRRRSKQSIENEISRARGDFMDARQKNG